MAETLFEELMKSSGNIVYRFGYEAIVQNLTQLAEKFDRYSEVGEKYARFLILSCWTRRASHFWLKLSFGHVPMTPVHEDTIKILERLDRFGGRYSLW